MGCVDTGAMVFAEAGLLAKTLAAVHFEALQSYREAYADPLRVPLLVDSLAGPNGHRCACLTPPQNDLVRILSLSVAVTDQAPFAELNLSDQRD